MKVLLSLLIAVSIVACATSPTQTQTQTQAEPAVVKVDISGRLVDPDGTSFKPGKGLFAFVELVNVADGSKPVIHYDVDSTGSYRLQGKVPKGKYRLHAHPFGPANVLNNNIEEAIDLDRDYMATKDITLTAPIVIGWVYTPEGQVFLPGTDSIGSNFIQGDSTWVRICLVPIGKTEVIEAERLMSFGNFRIGVLGDVPDGDYLLFAQVMGPNPPFGDSDPVKISVNSSNTASQEIYLTKRK
jgi:hypothetical protein